MPFPDDLRCYTFPSLDTLISKKGDESTKHPCIPPDEQREAMVDFLDVPNLREVGDTDEEGMCCPRPLYSSPDY